MSESPPTPAAEPPTAFDIIPDILTTGTCLKLRKSIQIQARPSIQNNQRKITLTAVALAGSASHLQPVSKNTT